ncbi:MAG: ribosome small subunit-dependent GTPase A, partial [Coriobacteriales bacterium]|nr:ribosome small subunit-dependent GTPase A [Coriobacteriales bacterium]
AQSVSIGVDVLLESAVTGDGLAAIRSLIAPGVTAALLGGSGVGKSTLVNRLLESDLLATAEVRSSDDKGRHTTVAREMVLMPEGGIVVDTPGMRALALWDAEEGMAAAFADVLEFATECRFRDCTHTSEPGCAVTEAVESGALPAHRLESFLGLRAELDELSRKQDERAWREKERESKILSKTIKRYYKSEPKRKR